MRRDPLRDPIIVSDILRQLPPILFIPAEQWGYWMVIAGGLFIFTHVLPTGLGWSWWFWGTLTLIIAWTSITGRRPYEYTDGLRFVPGDDWDDGHTLYLSPVAAWRSPELRARIPDHQLHFKLQPYKKDDGEIMFPFQRHFDALCLFEICTDDYDIAGVLHEHEGKFQLTFALELIGPHDVLPPNTLGELAAAIEGGFKEIPQGETITVQTQCGGQWYQPEQDRIAQLERQAARCPNPAVATLLLNEEKRIVDELSPKRILQPWKQVIYVTYSVGNDGTPVSGDLITKAINGLQSAIQLVAGSKYLRTRQQFEKILRNGLEGYQRWMQLLTTRMNLNVTPMDSTALWQWLWNELNTGKAPAVPQVMQLDLRKHSAGYGLCQEIRNSDRHMISVLIHGNGRSSCPEHRGGRDRVYLPGLQKQVGLVAISDPPKMWNSTIDQAHWLYEVLCHTKDVKVITQIQPAPNWLIQDSLAKVAKASKNAKKEAAIRGQGRDMYAELKQEESFEAQREFAKGSKALYVATVLMVYRDTQDELTQECNSLCHRFGTARARWERQIAFEWYKRSLPLTTQRLLKTIDIGSERRLVLNSSTVLGFLPLIAPHSLDHRGIPLIGDPSGQPLYVDIHSKGAVRIGIIGASGCGKSSLTAEAMKQAIADGIPITGMDISASGSSTFRSFVELLGDDGAYYRIGAYDEDGNIISSNLMEPPDLRGFPSEVIRERLQWWKESCKQRIVAIAMSRLQNLELLQRVTTHVGKLIEIFTTDPINSERYRLAFEGGWKSQAWKEMPTLKDFRRICEIQWLNLKDPTPLDKAAISLIASQIDDLLRSPIGDAIGNVTSFNPDPRCKFFGLSGLKSEHDAYIAALNADAAAERTALAADKSLFIGDELAVLLKRAGFAEIVGERCSTGRKDGISMILISQDLNAFEDCPAAAQILQNITHWMVGLITSDAVDPIHRLIKIPREVLSYNCSDGALPDDIGLSSYWLVARFGKYWRTRYYPGLMTLTALASHPPERNAWNRWRKQYPNTLKGQLKALSDFSGVYAHTRKSKGEFDDIAPDTPTATTPEARSCVSV